MKPALNVLLALAPALSIRIVTEAQSSGIILTTLSVIYDRKMFIMQATGNLIFVGKVKGIPVLNKTLLCIVCSGRLTEGDGLVQLTSIFR